ncbi:MAG TPA: FadR/GntR family transcriptional regulator [Solirubrobacteraceae bacterium]|jgi:GntR family transcriptional repressor for pyruvate dehydrogenase complex|nr:FadR/GntR family transcriptional regulator [Solirubrobacteraceae bacterium]
MQTSESSRRRPPVYASVQARLREYAADSALRPGDRLPPERELARLLGVSRSSLRQALMVLRIDGLVDVQHGNGVYLLRSPTDTVPPLAAELRERDPELPSLGEVRNSLEALGAELAASRRTDDDLAGMVAGIRRMDEEVAAGQDGLAGDRIFHAAVLAAAHNPVLRDLLGSIQEGSARIATASLRRAGQPARSLAAHRLILEAIVARDPELARRMMSVHLQMTGEIECAPGALG